MIIILIINLILTTRNFVQFFRKEQILTKEIKKIVKSLNITELQKLLIAESSKNLKLQLSLTDGSHLSGAAKQITDEKLEELGALVINKIHTKAMKRFGKLEDVVSFIQKHRENIEQDPVYSLFAYLILTNYLWITEESQKDVSEQKIVVLEHYKNNYPGIDVGKTPLKIIENCS